jgi:hypothetical protein
MSASLDEQRKLDEQALHYVNALPTADEKTLSEFNAWVRASPDHSRAYLEQKALGENLRALVAGRKLDAAGLLDRLAAALSTDSKVGTPDEACSHSQESFAKEPGAPKSFARALVEKLQALGRQAGHRYTRYKKALPKRPPRTRRRATEKKPRNTPDHFLAALAGYDLNLVPQYAGEDEEHERKRLVRIGASVTVPALVAFFTTCFFLAPLVPSLPARIVASALVAGVILMIDCIVVTTLVKSNVFNTLPRVVLSVCMSLVIAEPVMLFLYQNSIGAKIQQHLYDERADRELRYSAVLQKYQQAYAQASASMADTLQKLKGYDTTNIGTQRVEEGLTRKIAAVAAVESAKHRAVEPLQLQKREAEDELQERTREIERLTERMAHENNGESSARAGQGPIYSIVLAARQATEAQVLKLRGRIQTIDTEIGAVYSDRAAEVALDRQLTAKLSSRNTASAVLTPEELADKERLVADLNVSRHNLATIVQEEQMIMGERLSLRADYMLSKHSDVLAQTAALAEILGKNWLLCIEAGTLFVLLLLIDMTPVLVKLTAKTGYDEYLKSIARARLMEADSRRDRYYELAANTAGMKVQRLCDFRDDVVDKLTQNFAHSDPSESVRAIYAKIGSAVEQCTEEMLQEVKNGPTDEELAPPRGRGPRFSSRRPHGTVLRN